VDNARYLEGEPGIDVAAAKWLIDQGIVAIGADTMAVEVLPNPDKTVLMPVHQFALAECGVYLIENLALEELAADRVCTGCLVLLATKIRGATGAPVRPIVMI
jgi:kynurenine formamidase